MQQVEQPVDLLIRNARLLATQNAQRDEIADGWVAISNGLIHSLGKAGNEPAAARTLDASNALVTPGLVNTHHHIWQNLTRAFYPATRVPFVEWLQTLVPLWSRLDEEAIHVSTWVGLAELALGGCTTTSDHLYLHPHGAGDLIAAEISAAREVGMRFHPTHGSISRMQADLGMFPDILYHQEDDILAQSESLISRFHDSSHGAMTRIALAPHSLMCASTDLFRRTAELANRTGVRLHTHLAADPFDEQYCLEHFKMRPVEYLESLGWIGPQTWVAHCIWPNPDEIQRLGVTGTGVAHCPSACMLCGAGLAPVHELRAAGSPVGIACDGSADSDTGSLWLESRTAMLLGRLRKGPAAMQARDVLDMATLEGAACLGRQGELGTLMPGAAGDVVVWPQEGVAFAGALSDPIEAWLRCGPTVARHTVVAGKVLVENGELQLPGVESMLARHAVISRQMQML